MDLEALNRLLRRLHRQGLIEGRTIGEIKTKSLFLMPLRNETLAYRLRAIGYESVSVSRTRVVWKRNWAEE